MINHQIQFESPQDLGLVRANLVSWLQAIGYRLATPPFLADLVFERGSAVGNATAVDPQKWLSKLTAEFRPRDGGGCHVSVKWQVVTAGQLVTKPDIEYWRMEVVSVHAAANGQSPDLVQFNRARAAAKNGLLWRVGVVVVLLIVPGVAAAFSPYPLNFLLYALMAVLGFATYFGFRAPRRL